MFGTSDCPDIATPFIAANFAREKLMASVAAQSNRKDNDTMNEQNALAPWPVCGAVPKPVRGAQIIGIRRQQEMCHSFAKKCVNRRRSLRRTSRCLEGER
jgi:hypothetical protein